MPTGSELAYLDASAIAKLVLREPESEHLRRALEAWPRRATSRLAVVELVRAVRRTDPSLEPHARRVLASVDLVGDTDRILFAAAQLGPPSLRTLDAIHLASALRERRVVTAFVSYDDRQLEAATALGLPAVAPH